MPEVVLLSSAINQAPRNQRRDTGKNGTIRKKEAMEEEDKKVESNSEIWRKHQEKESKGLRKIFIFIFLAFVVFYIVNNGLTETKDQILNFFNVLN